MRPRIFGGTLLVSVIASSAAAQGSLPPLPDLAPDRFPESARVSVTRAYDAAKARPTDAASVGAFARVLHAWEQWDAAHAAYVRAQALAPEAFDWHYLDALLLQRLARHPEAAERLEAAVKADPDYKPARVKLAEALFEAGKVEESRKLFDALARDPATEPLGQFGLGRIAAAERRHDAAVAHFTQALARFSEWGGAYYALALSYRALGRRDDAQRALERHAQYGPTWPALEDPVLGSLTEIRDDARAVLARGIALAERGDVAGAIAAHEAALAKDPSLLTAHANLISLYGRTANWAKGEEHYLAALKLGGDTADIHYDYGVLLGLQKKWKEAEGAYRKALAANPLHARAHNNLGEVLERQQHVDAALTAYQSAVSAQPLFRLARFNVARMLLALRRTDEAVSHLEKLSEPRDAEAPRYLFGLAAAYVRAGRKDEAIKWASEAKRLAVEYGQTELAAAIERDLAKLK